jgi:hypothetical protein
MLISRQAYSAQVYFARQILMMNAALLTPSTAMPYFIYAYIASEMILTRILGSSHHALIILNTAGRHRPSSFLTGYYHWPRLYIY